MSSIVSVPVVSGFITALSFSHAVMRVSMNTPADGLMSHWQCQDEVRLGAWQARLQYHGPVSHCDGETWLHWQSWIRAGKIMVNLPGRLRHDQMDSMCNSDLEKWQKTLLPPHSWGGGVNFCSTFFSLPPSLPLCVCVKLKGKKLENQRGPTHASCWHY